MAEIIGSAAIEIKAKDKNFEKEVRRIASQIKKVEIPVDAVVNTDKAKAALETFRKGQQGRRLKLFVDVDTRKATSTLDNLIKRYHSKEIVIKTNVDTKQVYDAAFLLEEFEEQYNNHSLHLGVEVEDSIKDEIDGIKDSLDNVSSSNKQMNLDVNTSRANAQLLTTAALAQATRRAISTPMRMNIDKQTLEGIKGFFYTLTGSIPIAKVKSVLTGISANFEGIAVKSGLVSSAVTALAGTLTHAVGDLLAIGGDVTEVVGILAAAPALIGAAGLSLTGTVLGWSGFGTALMGEGKEAAEALKLLPPEAREAVKALDGVGSSIRRTTQTRYWKGMGTAVQDVMGAIRKDLDTGMGNAGEALGGQMSAIFGAVQEFGESGGLSNTFRDLTEFFKTSTPALEGFTSGFLDLMEGGARDMPVFGTWLSSLGQDFKEWSRNANETGLINEWIATGTQRMKELGKVTQATYGMFSGLTSAARNAGMNGLTELASGMVDVSNAMNERSFQQGLTSFFTSARIGAANALPGVGGFFEMMGDGLPTINSAVEKSGTVVGNMFENITRAFANGNMGEGFLEMLDGMIDATDTLEPGFESLGDALGGAMEVAGEVVRNVAPGLNELFSTIDIVINNMKEGIIDAMPVFNEFVQGLLAGIKSVLDPLSSFAGTALSAFSSLPGPLQTAAMSIGAVVGATALLNKRFPNMVAGMGQVRTGARNMASGVANSLNSGFIGPLGRTGSAVRGFVSSNSKAASNIRTIWQNNAKAQQNIILDGAMRRAQITKRVLVREQKLIANQTSGVGRQMLPTTTGAAGVATSITRIQSNARTAAASASASLGSIGKTAGVVGGQIAKSIGGGLLGVLGGPWGLAITAGVAGLAVLGQAAADQKQKVEDLYQTLTDQGKITSGTQKTMAEQIYGDKGSWVDATLAFGNFQLGGENVGKTLDKLDISSNDLVDSLVRGGSEAVDVWTKLDTLGANSGSNLLRDGLVSKADLDLIGMSEEKFKSLNRTELSNLVGSMQNVSDATKEAIARADNMKKSFSELATSQIADNKMVLESQTSSLEEKMSAFKSNMQLGGLENLSGQQGFYQLGQVAEQNTSQIKNMKTELGEAGKSLRSTFDSVDVGGGKNVAMFKMSTTAGRQMYDVMRTQADGIHAATMGTYDTVLKQTKDVGTATSAAMKVAKEETAKFVTELKGAGLDDSAIATLLDTAGLSAEDIKIAITTEGVDQAISEALRVEAALQAFRTGDYSATLQIMDSGVREQITDTLGLAENFSNNEFTAKIAANFTNQAEYQAWMQDFTSATDEKRIQMIMELTGAEDARAKIDEALGKGEQFNGKSWSSTIKTISEETGVPVDTLIGKINSMPKEQITKIIAETEGDPAARLKALIESKPFKATVKAEVDGDPLGDLKTSAGHGVTVPIKAEAEKFDARTALGLNGPGGAPGANLITIDSKVNPPTNLPDISIPDVDVDVTATANTSGVDQVKSTMDSISDKTVSVQVNANESNLAHIKSSMDALTDKTVSVQVNANESNLNTIKSSMEALTNKTVSVTVNANESNLGFIKSSMDSLVNKTVSVSVNANAGGVLAIQSAMNSIVSKTVAVTVDANVGPVSALRAAIAAIVSKSVTITATAPTAAVIALRTAIASVRSKTVSVMASTNTGAVLGLVSAINAVRSKSVTVTVNTRQVGANADGGMYMSGVRTFAKGGVDDPRIAKALARAQRTGGKENHVAQIAQGSNNYRVWGEPETQGEAYIPLAMSKKVRSLKILEQVAQHFGYSLSQFADGGFSGGMSGTTVAPGVTTHATGSTSATRNRTAKQKEEAKKRSDDIKKLSETIKKSIADLKKSLSSSLTDLKKAFGANDASPAQKALGDMRTAIRDFKNETAKSIKESKKLGKSTTTLSKQVSAATKLDKRISSQRVSSNVWNREGNNVSDSRFIGRDSIRRQRTKALDYNARYTARDYERALGYLEAELEKQQSKLDNMVENHRNSMESVANGLFGNFDISSLVKSKDDFGYRPPTTSREISSYASKMLKDMKTFSKNLKDLRKAGYNESIINQISNMGLEEGIVVANALLSDKSQMNSINSSFTQMFGRSGDMNIDSEGNTYVGGLARSIGKNGANAMFSAGVNVQRGLVKGLTSEVSAIEKSGQTLADALVKSFKNALRIKSPSRVFEDLGKFIPQGLVRGVDSGQRAVNSSISNLVQPKRLSFGSDSRSTNSSGIINGNRETNPVTVNVYPSEGMSEKQVGTTAAREIYYRMDSAL